MILGLRLWGIGVVLGAAACIGCNVDSGQSSGFNQHCRELQGDATCSSTYSSRPFCSICTEANQGCVIAAPAVICQPDPPPATDDGGTTTDDTPDTSSSGGSSTAALDTSGDGESSGEPPCAAEGELDPQCMALDPMRPFCADSACVGCQSAGGDAFCGELDALAPACGEKGGPCVPCSEVEHNPCAEANPVCGATGACEPCTQHAQCSSGACHRSPEDPLLGFCFADEDVIYIDNTAACPGLGTADEPACSLQDVSESLVPGDSRVLRIAGGTPYLDRANFLGKMEVAIIGDGLPVISGAPGQNAATLRIEGGVRAYISNVRLNNNAFSHGLLCNNSTVNIETSEIRDNDGWGMFDFDPCDLHVDRVMITGNEDGGIRIDEGQLTLVNSAIAVNGIGGSSTGIRADDANLDILYSTIVGNNGSGPDSLECSGVTGTLRNSIISGVDAPSMELDCFPLVMDNNAVDSANFAGGNNTLVGAYDPIQFNGPEEGDLTLAAPPLSPFGDVALWQEGDPTLDADGTLRPIDDMPGFAGLDEP